MTFAVLDAIFKNLWLLICISCGFAIMLLKLIFLVTITLLRRTGEKTGLEKVYAKFAFLGRVWHDAAQSDSVNYLRQKVLFPLQRLKIQLDSSARARRYFFIVAFLLIALVISIVEELGWQKCQTGIASWYGPGFYYRQTASGELFKPGNSLTAAHKTLPLGTRVLVINNRNHKRVVVRINDRGPYVKNRIIDLSKAAAKKIGMLRSGTAPVTLYVRR